MVNLHALLIGINHYEKNDICSSLYGAVADIEAMEAYLLSQGVSAGRIRKLTVSNSVEGPPPEPRDTWPTYENMVVAMQQLTLRAEPGDHVLIHYSGHGGQVKPTLIPAAKTIDEGLIPPNIGEDGARYLRDVELTYLLHQMAKKRLQVTLIVDACHSAGTFREGARFIARGSRKALENSAVPESLIASRQELETTWRKVHNRAYANVPMRGKSPSGWLEAPQDMVLLAACRSIESAYEYPFAGNFRGLLTYYLLEILSEGGHDLSFQRIHRRLVSRVHGCAPTQTPVLEGAASGLVFGDHLRGDASDHTRSRGLLDAIEVLDVEPSKGRVQFGAGQAVGLAPGARLKILPADVTAEQVRRAKASPRLPIVRITEISAFKSWGDVTDESGKPPVQRGDRAILIDPGTHFRRRVMLAQAHEDNTLDAVRQELNRRASSFLELIDETGSASDPPAEFLVTIKQDESRPYMPREIEICHSSGGVIADLPLPPTTDPRAAQRVVDCLEQLARFHNVRDLENRDRSSPLHEALTVELGLLPKDFAPGYAINPQPFAPQDPMPRVEVGRWICLTITNHAMQALEITVLDLQPGWTIEQIFPSSGTETLEGGTAINLPLQIYLPVHLNNRREVLKVFGTVEPVDFRWLQLPTIGRPAPPPPRIRGARRNPLERLFAEIAQSGPRTRSPETHYASRHWTSAQIEFEVVELVTRGRM